MRIGILGGGLAGVSLACFLQECGKIEAIEVLEKEAAFGGLCRSYPFGGLHYDVGPHIMFSKNAEVLGLMARLLGENIHQLRRSNRIFHDGRFVKYPFENELSALAPADRDHCLETFLDNPYSHYQPQTMLQFFLATFGEGMTDLYLRPYNEKIWKFDPAFLDLQMVQRIPKPPAEDIIRSAKGEASEGYLHQLHFRYPKQGGIQAFFDGFLRMLGSKVTLRSATPVDRVCRRGESWRVRTAAGAEHDFDRLISTIPIPDLVGCLEPAPPPAVADAAGRLKFNSIAICCLQVAQDGLGDNFAVMVADRDIVFHRVSKLNFLLPEDRHGGPSVLMAEVTYRKRSALARLDDDELLTRVAADLARLGFIASPAAVLDREILRQGYAYVIYDLDHRRNVDVVRAHCEKQLGLVLHGRFGEFEYLNMDAVVERSLNRSKEIAAAVA